MNEEPPKDYIEAALDVIVLGAGFGLIAYLKFHYASDVGAWALSLIGYQ